MYFDICYHLLQKLFFNTDDIIVEHQGLNDNEKYIICITILLVAIVAIVNYFGIINKK